MKVTLFILSITICQRRDIMICILINLAVLHSNRIIQIQCRRDILTSLISTTGKKRKSQKVNNFKQRDEIYIHRLSSFFYDEGELEIRKITPVKKHDFYIETGSETDFILKRHQKRDRIEQQWCFFERMQKMLFVPLR